MKDYRSPRGTQDILPPESSKWQKVEMIMQSLAHYYGYQQIETPIFEDTGVFKRENDSSDMVNKEMYTFSINNVDSLTLRPEGTAGVIRSYVQNKMYALPDQPVKLYYLGPMFRYERPQKGRYRQFNQFGIECVGAKSPLLDAEGIALGYSIVKALGLSQIVVKINSLGDNESRKNYREKLISYFTPHALELCPDCQRRLNQNPLRILDCKEDKDNPVLKEVPLISSSLNQASKEYFDKVKEALEALDIPYEVDDKLVRGLDYYTDTVFEVQSTNPLSGTQNTVFAGGRYDGLVNYFGGPEVSGFGFAMGIERLLLLAQDEKIDLGSDEKTDIYVMSIGEVGTKALEIATVCRAMGYVTGFTYENKSLKSQFKTVERLGAKLAIIVGETELANNQVNIKDLRNSEQSTVDLDELSETIDKMLGEK